MTGSESPVPNVVQVTCHDLGRHVAPYGVETVETPAFDRVAGEGVRFEQSFTCAPQCSPSRAAIATGRYPHENGVMGLVHDEFAWDLHEDERHVAGVLGDAGWRTGVVGIHHETRRPAAFFDEVHEEPFHCEAVSDAAAAFVDRHAGGDPFYLQVGYFEPHRMPGSPSGFGPQPRETTDGVTVPAYLEDDAGARREVAAFEGAIERVDAAIGRLLDALDAAGVADETILLLTTDHGIPFPRAKCSPYDPGIETCLFVRWPGTIAADVVRDEVVTTVDHLPTLLDLVDVEVPEGVSGRSVAPLLTGADETVETDETDDGDRFRETLFGEMTYHDYCDPRRWLRTDRHKLIVNFTTAPSFMDPTQSWRPETVTRHPVDPALAYHPPVELYDLEADPLETENLADERPGVRDALLARLGSWLERTDDPILQGIPTPPAHERAVAALADADADVDADADSDADADADADSDADP
jgi:arylsulfatase A-like enzyme